MVFAVFVTGGLTVKVLLVNNEKEKTDLGRLPELIKSVSQIVPANFEVKHFTEVSSRVVADNCIDYVILSGRYNSSWDLEEEPLFQGEYDLIRNCTVPLLGICAGMQLMGIAYGVEMDYICLKEKEKVNENGYTEVKIVHFDKLFQGLSSPITVYEHHYCEIKGVPEGFINLASSSLTPIQCIKDKNRHVYGVQFHPERFSSEYEAGKIILNNFFNMV